MTGPANPWAKPPKGLRTRMRKAGLRVWWEPTATQRAAGFEVVELDAERVTWSRRKADDLNRQAARKLSGKTRIDGRRTVAALIETYIASSQFRDKRPKTRASYRGLMPRIRDRIGHQLVSAVSKPMLYAWYDDLRAETGLRMAQAVIVMVSGLMAHAERIGWRDAGTNPAEKMNLKQPPRRHRVATWDELDALLSACDALGEPGMALAICASAFGGQRREDVARMTVGQFTTLQGPTGPVTVLQLVRSKRTTAGILPVHPEWDRRLRLVLAAAAAPTDSIVTLPDGRPMTETMFRNRYDWARTRAAETLPDIATLQFRDLRRTFGALARSAGTSREDVAAVLGNTVDTNFALGLTYMPPELQAATRAVAGIKRGGGQ